MDDGRLALVQARNGLTGVTEDLQYLGLCEARLQPLVHQIYHLASCKTVYSISSMKSQASVIHDMELTHSHKIQPEKRDVEETGNYS